MKRCFPFAAAALTSLWLAGCGDSGSNCNTVNYISVSPASATLLSSAKAPGNQQKFTATSTPALAPGSSRSCALPAVVAVVPATWTNPDPLHISISSANDSTNGLATCLGPTGGPVTLSTPGKTATGATPSVQLTCQ